MARLVVFVFLLMFVFVAAGISEVTTKREPVVAAICSIVVPGAGQGYNGQWTKAAVCLGGSIIGWSIAISSLEDDFTLESPQLELRDGYEGAALIGMLIGLGSHVYSIIDAPVTAKNINKRLAQPKLSIAPTQRGVMFSYRF